jgi:hypothetical protein
LFQSRCRSAPDFHLFSPWSVPGIDPSPLPGVAACTRRDFRWGSRCERNRGSWVGSRRTERPADLHASLPGGGGDDPGRSMRRSPSPERHAHRDVRISLTSRTRSSSTSEGSTTKRHRPWAATPPPPPPHRSERAGLNARPRWSGPRDRATRPGSVVSGPSTPIRP